MNHKLDTLRLEQLIKMFLGCKWSDCGPLVQFKPEYEKYITAESLLNAIDSQLKDK